MGKRRDTNELLQLADIYLDYTRCIGGHLVHSRYCCTWCGSTDPSSAREGICWKEKVRGPEHQPKDYKDPKTRKQVKGFRIYGS